MVRKSVRWNHEAKKVQFALEALEHRLLLSGPGEDQRSISFDLTRFESAGEMEQFLVEDALKKWDSLFGQPAWPYYLWGGPYLEGDMWRLAPAAAVDGIEKAPDHSNTNTQVADVDEADLVETDGDYLYLLSGQELVIADAWPHEELQVASRLPIDGQPFGQYLRGDRLTIVSQEYDYIGIPEPWPLGRPGGIAIDVAMPFVVPSRPTVKLTVLDVSDRSNPSVVQETEIEGSYVDSRAIDNFVYFVTSDNFGLPAPEIHCVDGGGQPVDPKAEQGADPAMRPIWVPPPTDQTCTYETREEYLARIEGQVLDLGLPNFSSYDGAGQLARSGLLSEATDIFKPSLPQDQNLLSVTVFDISSGEPGRTSSTSVPTTYSSEVYASKNNLYVVNPDWGWGWNSEPATSIFKFAIQEDGSRVELTAAGEVPGRILNSFSIDEHNDYLRIATSTGWGAETDNRVFVLQQSGDDLSVVGRSEGLARGEQIFSVRFMEETAYVVTFLRVDPLFTLDLSDPTQPKVVGELHIPGFSNYLQSVSDNFLIGIGNDADERTGQVKGLQLSLFDISNLSSPELADRFSFDLPGWAWTEATNDHHAVSYFPEHQVLAIPITNDNGWVSLDRDGDGIDDVQAYRPQTDLWVFRIHLPDGAGGADEVADIELLGRIEHDTQVRRSVRIEDGLYSISDASIKVHEILDPTSELASLHFGQVDVGVPVFKASPDDPLVSIALLTPERAAPQVVDVTLGSSSWTHGFVNLLDAQSAEGADELMEVVPYTGIDQIKVTFSEDVFVGLSDLTVRGVNQTRYDIANFAYDAEIATAVWTLASPVDADTLTVQLRDIVRDTSGNRLDGDVNGSSAGTFRYQFQILPGDVTGDGQVDRSDLITTLANPKAKLGESRYNMLLDLDGNGAVEAGDQMAIGQRTGTALPTSTAPVADPGDANADGVFDQLDIVQILQSGKYRTGQPADWTQGDFNRDGVFDQLDLIAALQDGTYQGGSKDETGAVDKLFGAGL